MEATVNEEFTTNRLTARALYDTDVEVRFNVHSFNTVLVCVA